MSSDKLIELLKRSQRYAARLQEYFSDVKDSYTGRIVTDHIEEIKSAIRQLEQTQLAVSSECAETNAVSQERHERDNDHLIHAFHGLSNELIRTTGELRSLLLLLSKFDLSNVEKTNMKISELSGAVTEVKTSALKAFSEIRNRIDVADARITTLETQLSDADIPAEAEAALADLRTILKQLDDIVPDAPELPPVVNPPTPV